MKEYKRTSKVTIILLVILSVIFMYGLPIGLGIWAAFSDISFPKYEEKNGEIIIDKGDLVISNVTSYYDSENDVFYIEGLLKNNEDKLREYINITFTIYDGDNNVLGEAEAYLNSLEGNGTWKFKAKYIENDARSVSNYKFSSIELY